MPRPRSHGHEQPESAEPPEPRAGPARIQARPHNAARPKDPAARRATHPTSTQCPGSSKTTVYEITAHAPAAMHLLQSDIPLVTINGAADLDDRARIAALADHLVDPRGAQIRILRQGVADERQIRASATKSGPCGSTTAR